MEKRTSAALKCGLILVGVMSTACIRTLPSDASMENSFLRERSVFEVLKQHLDEDNVSNGLQMVFSSRPVLPEQSRSKISEQRLQLYRQELRQIEVQAIMRLGASTVFETTAA